MKTINFKEIKIDEVIIRPQDGLITILYTKLDDQGDVIAGKTLNLKQDNLPGALKTALTGLINKIINSVDNHEGL